MKEFGIGLLGFGTVGAGVVEGLRGNGDLIAERLGARLVVRRIADLDLETDRGVTVGAGVLTTDAAAVVDDPSIDIVIELIGGTTASRELTLRALKLGKPVVTANKKLLADYGEEIFRQAEEGGTDIYFSASVGGGIPIIRALREGLIANRFLRIVGILNGTCNYILSRMEQAGMAFDDALAEAQRAGYAEADPGLDIDGWDTAHKAVILAALAYGVHIKPENICVEGIRGLAVDDIACARDLGYRIKLLALVKRRHGGIEVRVHPAFVPREHMLASVSQVYNAVMVQGDLVGETLYYGHGAGRGPTASTVIGDVADVARNLMAGTPRHVPGVVRTREAMRILDPGDTETRYYLRLSLLDKPGMLARLASVLGSHGISIASVVQSEARHGEYVPVIVVTHLAREREFAAAIGEIEALDFVAAPVARLRIED